MKLLKKSTLQSIKQNMELNGFEHVLYGTIFIKDGVHVYLSRYSSGNISVIMQKLEDPNVEGSNVLARDNGGIYYALFASDIEIAELVTGEANRLVQQAN